MFVLSRAIFVCEADLYILMLLVSQLVTLVQIGVKNGSIKLCN